MSTMARSGLDGVSTHTSRVSSRHAASSAADEDRSTGVWAMPNGPHTLSIRRNVPP